MNWREGWPVRMVAGLTAGYSAAITVAPGILARPCRLTEPDGRVPAAIAHLIRSTGMRDAAMAVALAASARSALELAYARRRWAPRAGTA